MSRLAMINKSFPSNPANKKNIEINKNIVQKDEKPSTIETNTIKNLNLKNNADKNIQETLSRLLGTNIARQTTAYSNILAFTNSPLKTPFNLALFIMNDYKAIPSFSNTAIFNKLLSAKVDINLLKDISHIINYRTLLFFPEIASFLPFFSNKTKLMRKFEADISKNIEKFIEILENLDDMELKNEALNAIIRLLSTRDKYRSFYFFDDDKINSIDFYCEDTNLFISGNFSNLGTIDIIAKLSKDSIIASIFTETEEIKNAICGIKDSLKDLKGKPVKINLYTMPEYNNAISEIKDSCRSCLNIDTLA